MTFLTFKEALRAFPVFSVREIEKHFPGFDNRRLVEWQEKGYIQKLRNRYYRFTDYEVDEAYLCYCANAIYAPSYVSWSRRCPSMVLYRKVSFKSLLAPHLRPTGLKPR